MNEEGYDRPRLVGSTEVLYQGFISDFPTKEGEVLENDVTNCHPKNDGSRAQWESNHFKNAQWYTIPL